MALLVSYLARGRTHWFANGFTMCGQLAIGWKLRAMDGQADCDVCERRLRARQTDEIAAPQEPA